MMGAFGSFVVLWIIVGMLFCVVVFGGIIWLFARLLNKKTPTMPNTPQPQSPYQTHEQGYQSPTTSTVSAGTRKARAALTPFEIKQRVRIGLFASTVLFVSPPLLLAALATGDPLFSTGQAASCPALFLDRGVAVQNDRPVCLYAR